MNGRMCECVDPECSPDGCTNPPYSWSQEHDNDVLCRICYQTWLKTRTVKNAANIFKNLSASDKKQLMEMIQNGS